MTFFFQILAYSAMIISVHELGHYLMLKILQVPIYAMGISSKPIPHFYIRYRWPKDMKKHSAIILSGSFLTFTCFAILYLFIDHSDIRYLIYAYSAQIIFETNPFFSDFVFATIINRNRLRHCSSQDIANYQLKIKEYLFSSWWYIHFILWFTLSLLVIKYIIN